MGLASGSREGGPHGYTSSTVAAATGGDVDVHTLGAGWDVVWVWMGCSSARIGHHPALFSILPSPRTIHEQWAIRGHSSNPRKDFADHWHTGLSLREHAA